MERYEIRRFAASRCEVHAPNLAASPLQTANPTLRISPLHAARSTLPISPLRRFMQRTRRCESRRLPATHCEVRGANLAASPLEAANPTLRTWPLPGSSCKTDCAPSLQIVAKTQVNKPLPRLRVHTRSLVLAPQRPRDNGVEDLVDQA